MDGVATEALADVSLQVKKGDFIAVIGPSGSGKSTLMHVIGLLDRPTSGTYVLDGEDVGGLSDDRAAAIRNRHIGFVFQAFNLLPRATAVENVALPLLYAGIAREKRYEQAKQHLTNLNLEDRLFHTPSQLSGGQQQRVAIARALVNDPKIILADEPTGNLDTKASRDVMEIFKKLNREGKTIILITHEREIAKYARRIIYIRDGRILPTGHSGKRGTSASRISLGMLGKPA